MAASSTEPFSAPAAPDVALKAAKPVQLGLTRLQLANRMNGAMKAKRLALLLSNKPIRPARKI